MNNQKTTIQNHPVKNYANFLNNKYSNKVTPQNNQAKPLTNSSNQLKDQRFIDSKLEKFIETRQTDIIKFLVEMKFATMKQLLSKFFIEGGDRQFEFAKSAILKIKELGLISIKDKELSLTTVVYPTQDSVMYLKSKFEGKVVPELKRVFEPAINHDLKLNDLRLKIETFKYFSKWYSERMLEAINSKFEGLTDLPDALIKKKNDRSFFLELEISKKSTPVYERRIQEYKSFLSTAKAEEQQIEGVIFVCTDPAVFNIIRQIADKQDFPISVKLFSDYINIQSVAKEM